SKMKANLREINLPASTFDFLINGSQLTHKKPHPEVFLRAAEGLGVPPESCLVVEDALNGVQAGKSAGAKVLALATTFSQEKLLAAGADFSAKDFTWVSKEVLGW
ncbi:MAG: HAD-IA family hydrolase, partial [Spirochaetia bacterium]|nr:HAD-IA family hydrolase [Spirochaetia bacterium]